jgi:hypothetical protein
MLKPLQDRWVRMLSDRSSQKNSAQFTVISPAPAKCEFLVLTQRFKPIS